MSIKKNIRFGAKHSTSIFFLVVVLQVCTEDETGDGSKIKAQHGPEACVVSGVELYDTTSLSALSELVLCCVVLCW